MVSEITVDRLRRIFKVDSNLQLTLVFIVFSITGSLSVVVSGPLMDLLGISDEVLAPWLFWPLRIAVVMLAYQVLLMAVAVCFGQGPYFWRMEKKMLRRFGIKLD